MIIIKYKFLSSLMNNIYDNKAFHNFSDEVAYKKHSYKNKYLFPCQLQQHIYVENKLFILHHYNKNKKDIIYYFPGGSFVDPPISFHYKYCKKLAKKLNRHVIMVQYPLFPESDPFNTAMLFCKIIKNTRARSFILMGDSAGANLSALILYCLHKDRINLIKKIVLFSPLVDKKIDCAERILISDYDFILSYENCLTLTNYVYKECLNDNNVFPMSDAFFYKSNFLIFSGEKELFTPDIRNWVKNAKNIKVTHYIYKDMCHCFPILPIKEANNCIKKIKNFIKTY